MGMAAAKAAARADPVRFISDWCWTSDPRDPDQITRPFDLFPRQVDMVRWLQELERDQMSGLVEKCRDSGVTWLCAAYAVWGWLFRPGFVAGVGSRQLHLVDKKGDPDTIFDKVRFILRHIPVEMMPAGFNPRIHDNLCMLLNPETRAVIRGEGGDQIGRGGRASIYFVDEHAFLEHPESVDRALSQTTRVQVDVSTPNGPGNTFYRKRFGGSARVFVFDWKDDPRKNASEVRDGALVYPWYEEQERRYAVDPVGLAREVDRDYSASIEGVAIPGKWVRAAVGLHERMEFLAAYPDFRLPDRRTAGYDVAAEGNNKNVVAVRRGMLIEALIDWGHINTTQSAWRAREVAQQYNVALVNYDSDGVGNGVKGTWEGIDRPDDVPLAAALGFEPVPVSGGSTPSSTDWPDGRSSRDRFANLRAELYWMARMRFERAFEFVTYGIHHDPTDMISIPNHPELIMQLSVPLYQSTTTGKLKIESKQDMRKRGVLSPDFADALIYSEMPEAPPLVGAASHATMGPLVAGSEVRDERPTVPAFTGAIAGAHHEVMGSRRSPFAR